MENFDKKMRGRAPKIFARGFTVAELLVYVAALAIVLMLVTQFTLGLIDASARANAKEEVYENGTAILQAFSFAAQSARSVYDPTSDFIRDPGQLSLATSDALPPHEKTSYADMYADKGRFCVKRELTGASCVSSSKVELTSLTFRKMTQAGGGESVQMRFTIRFRSVSPKYYAQDSFQTSARLRAY